MEPIEFPIEFSEFLILLNAHRVEFLLIGGLAVSHQSSDAVSGALRHLLRNVSGHLESLV
jgi:hypothetical protein